MRAAWRMGRQDYWRTRHCGPQLEGCSEVAPCLAPLQLQHLASCHLCSEALMPPPLPSYQQLSSHGSSSAWHQTALRTRRPSRMLRHPLRRCRETPSVPQLCKMSGMAPQPSEAHASSGGAATAPRNRSSPGRTSSPDRPGPERRGLGGDQYLLLPTAQATGTSGPDNRRSRPSVTLRAARLQALGREQWLAMAFSDSAT